MQYVLYFLLSLQVFVSSATQTNISQVCICAGGLANLTCQINATKRRNNIVWTLNNQTLVDGQIVNNNTTNAKRIKVQITDRANNLQIVNTTEEDSELYCCQTYYEGSHLRFCTQLVITDIVHSTEPRTLHAETHGTDDVTKGSARKTTEQMVRKSEGNIYLFVGVTVGFLVVNGICCCMFWNKKIRPNNRNASTSAERRTNSREIHEYIHVYHTVRDEDVLESGDNMNEVDVENLSNISCDRSEHDSNYENVFDSDETFPENQAGSRPYTSLVDILPENLHEYEKPEKSILPDMAAMEDQNVGFVDLTDDNSCRSEGNTSPGREATEKLSTISMQYQGLDSANKNDSKLDMSVTDILKDLEMDDISLD